MQVAEEENLKCKIGFFLHIPFPQWDIFKIFPWEDQILQVYLEEILYLYFDFFIESVYFISFISLIFITGNSRL